MNSDLEMPWLQGGKEAARSNAILHKIITETIEDIAPEVGGGLINLVTTRQGVDDLLGLDDVIDLVSLTKKLTSKSQPIPICQSATDEVIADQARQFCSHGKKPNVGTW